MLRPVIILVVDDREAAWDELREVLPKGWRTGPPSYDPETRLMEIVAMGPKVGGRHGPPPESVSGFVACGRKYDDGTGRR